MAGLLVKMEKKSALLSLTKNNNKTGAVLACISGLGGRKQNLWMELYMHSIRKVMHPRQD